MLTKIRVANLDRDDLEDLVIPLFDPSSYFVKYIDGLNPTMATLSTSTYASLDGDFVQNARAEPRNVVLTVGFSPAYHMGQNESMLRVGLYKWLTPKTNVRLTFEYDDMLYTVEGVVETHESDIFVKEPASQISVHCPQPYFKGGEPIVHEQTTASGNYVYQGDVATGLNIRAKIKTAVSSLSVVHTYNGKSNAITLSHPFLVGDEVRISTVPGHKRVYLVRNNQGSAILDKLSDDSVWIGIGPGNNQYLISRISEADWEIEYTERFSGI